MSGRRSLTQEANVKATGWESLSLTRKLTAGVNAPKVGLCSQGLFKSRSFFELWSRVWSPKPGRFTLWALHLHFNSVRLTSSAQNELPQLCLPVLLLPFGANEVQVIFLVSSGGAAVITQPVSQSLPQALGNTFSSCEVICGSSRTKQPSAGTDQDKEKVK